NNALVAPEKLMCDESASLAALLSEAASSSRSFAPDESAEIAQAYINRLKDKWRKKKQREISAAIKKAEAQGDETALLKLLTEKKSLLN
ncbi:MAG: hypothetical protein ACRCTY_09370, partial [Candidatus Adiutrix sp.]